MNDVLLYIVGFIIGFTIGWFIFKPLIDKFLDD